MDITNLISSVIDFLILVLPIVIPIFLAILLWDFWLAYVREKFINSQEYVLLKIVPPTTVLKTPLAMELFINGLYQTHGETTPFDRYWAGKLRPWFSLEIAANNGKVNFYIWTRKNASNFVESQLYAQYPGIEISEVEDYATKFEFDREKHQMWALEYKFEEDNSIPIKTYVDFGLDKPSDDEEKADPITPILELFGAAGEKEHLWLQIIIKAHKKEDKKTGSLFGKTDLWKDNSKDIVKKITQEFQDEDKDGNKRTLQPSEIQKERIAAIQRSQGKVPFDVGIRAMYISEDKGNFLRSNIGGLLNLFKQYSSPNLNTIKSNNTTNITYKFQDPFGNKIKEMEDQHLTHYRERAYFFKAFRGSKRPVMVMNAEELASIYHFPGSVAITPNIERVQSRKSNAPSDLPM